MKKNQQSSYTSLEEPFNEEIAEIKPRQRKRRKKTWFDYLLTFLIIALFAG